MQKIENKVKKKSIFMNADMARATYAKRGSGWAANPWVWVVTFRWVR